MLTNPTGCLVRRGLILASLERHAGLVRYFVIRRRRSKGAKSVKNGPIPCPNRLRKPASRQGRDHPLACRSACFWAVLRSSGCVRFLNRTRLTSCQSIRLRTVAFLRRKLRRHIRVWCPKYSSHKTKSHQTGDHFSFRYGQKMPHIRPYTPCDYPS